MEAGSVVISKAGRDKGNWFIVLSAENGYVFLADGSSRKVDKPKKKKIKHIQKTNSVSGLVQKRLQNGGQVENFEIRRALSEFKPID